MAWLVAGLGNPGPEYKDTRHNVGAMVVDLLAERAGTRLRRQRLASIEAVDIPAGGGGGGDPEDSRVWLARSLRYMNESGPIYVGFARSHRVPVERLIVVHDELDLPLGALQVRVGGGTAGHNGLRSLVAALRAPDFIRIRVGIGRPPGRQDPADYVLEPFRSSERDEVAVLVEEAADAALVVVREGTARAQDRYNRSGPRA